MIRWAPYAFVRLTLALAAGILTYLYVGEALPPMLWPLVGLVLIFMALQTWANRQLAPVFTDAAGLLAVLCVYTAGLALTQYATESRAATHFGRLPGTVEFYSAVVDDYVAPRPTTYATTLRISAVRIGGRWHAAEGSVRVTVMRRSAGAAPRYGDVWLVRGAPQPARSPLNPGEFDYRRYLGYHQIFHQQFIGADQYRLLGFQPPSYVKALSLRTARTLDGVFRHYVKSPREYALASALVLGLKDDVDQETKQAYANTGTTHIMAVSGLQVGLLLTVFMWVLTRFFGATRGFRYWSAAVGLVVIWGYAFVTGASASVLRAATMFTFVIMGRAFNRQSNMYNTLAVAAFVLLCYNPYLLADVGFQLSFLAVLSIVYLQPRIAKWVDFKDLAASRLRSWQSQAVQRSWKWAGWVADWVWQAVALSLAAQVATFPLGLYYFHQFPLSFLLSNLVAVPISSLAVVVGVGLLAIKGLVAAIQLVMPAAAFLDWLPRTVAWLFERTIWLFNEYIFWIGRQLPNALITGIHLTPAQTGLLFAVILALLAFLALHRLPWLGVACALLAMFTGSRVWAERQLGKEAQFIVYNVPHRSVCGFWQGSVSQIVTPDSLPLSGAGRAYHIEPGLVEHQMQQVAYQAGWHDTAVPATCATDGLVLTVWHGLRVAFVSGRVEGARQPYPVDVVVLRRNARVRPEELAVLFGHTATVVLDSSCKFWYAAKQTVALQEAGLQVYDVAKSGAFTRKVRD
ncbi:ComEC/Rec2 family competence protein [Hymenobacter jejuensis]|uniref:ComEC family competence protein n=1 Tax=Hymenobacter jejuensis TaxID=2502781 RepID=A0A5B7ZVW0_9BACT|nr:ComEC/Rec2 family competence protein [Hymenobacter jejuensis]QDA59108.1 ComEC family competence protein [Hymenobacter jejuensis]